MCQFERPEYQDVERRPLLNLVPLNAQRILDIGCNLGGFGQSIKAIRNVEIWGIEPDVQSAKVARERLDHVIVDFFHADNPIPDNYFDLITFNDSLEHMIDPAQAIELCKKKLKPQGRIHCCVPNMRHIENLEHLIFEKDWRYEDQGIRDRTHLRFFAEKALCACLKNMGFRVDEL
ncbi:MAG: class I SAM-dependent methyltransferase [Candidatus Competibacteraceae bacterium]|nr:class I SAM-dependent methyltransferase [Candidatus Competibacteraceae bacterium]